jgi:hypothetical protein
MNNSLLEALLNHDPILIATARANYRKQLMYLPESEWKRRLTEMDERSCNG